MTSNRRGAALLVVTIMIISMLAIPVAMGAAPSTDTENSETSQQTDITDASTQSYNQTTVSNLSWIADSNNSKVIIEQQNQTIYEASPDPYYTNSTSGDSYYNVTLADDGSDYSGLHVGATEDAQLNVTFINDTTLDNPDTSNISYTFANGEQEAFVDVDSAKTEADDSDFLSGLSLGSDDSPDAARETKEIAATNNTSTVTFTLTQGNLSDAVSHTVEKKSAGDLVWASYIQAEGQYVPLYYQEAGDEAWLDNSTDAYATVDDSGSNVVVTLHNADQFTDADTVALETTITGNEMLGTGNAKSMLKSYDAGWWTRTETAWAATDWDGTPEFEAAS